MKGAGKGYQWQGLKGTLDVAAVEAPAQHQRRPHAQRLSDGLLHLRCCCCGLLRLTKAMSDTHADSAGVNGHAQPMS